MTTIDPLVSTEWLAENLGKSNVKVVDASFKMPGVLPLPKDDYLAKHIPGAVFFDVDAVSDHSNPLPHMFPSAEQFGRDAGALGIGNDDTVVIYDSGGWVAAPRAWWMFLSFGKEVRILNGGLKKWVAEGRLSRLAYSGRCLLRRRRGVRSFQPAAAHVPIIRTVRPRCRRARDRQ